MDFKGLARVQRILFYKQFSRLLSLSSFRSKLYDFSSTFSPIYSNFSLSLPLQRFRVVFSFGHEKAFMTFFFRGLTLTMGNSPLFNFGRGGGWWRGRNNLLMRLDEC